MRIRLFLGFVLVVLLTGCGGGGAKPKTVVVPNAPKEDSQKIIKDLAQSLNLATEINHYRNATALVNAWLARNGAAALLDPEEKKFLQEQAQLNADELTYLEANTCSPLDAHHLSSCFLFHDAAAKLDLAEASPLERAQVALAWVMRRVVLHEQGDEDLPPALVLRRGFGNALDRALVGLEMLRALDLDAGLVTDPKERTILIAVLIGTDQDRQLALFDPRLGLPVAGPKGQGVATLAQVTSQPALLQATGLPADAVSKLEVRAAVPLEALAGRLVNLEKELAKREKVRLAQPLGALCRRLSEAAGGTAAVWKPAADQGALANSPLRRARLFYPPSEGGIGDKGRWNLYQSRFIPLTAVQLKFQEMNLGQDLIAEARADLVDKIGALFATFYLQPEELFLRGRHEAVFDRLARLRDEIETPLPFDEREFPKLVAQWRDNLNEAYLRKQRKEAGAEARINDLWKEDQFFPALVRLDVDLKPYRSQRKMLTHVVLHVCQDLLNRQAASLLADCLHEKAAALQTVVDRQTASGKNPNALRAEAVLAWDNARGGWLKVLDRQHLGPQRLEAIRRASQRHEYAAAVGLWEDYHRDLHASLRARRLLAQTQAYGANAVQQAAALQKLHDDLGKLLQQDDVRKPLEQDRDRLKGLKIRPLTDRLDLLLRDWAPQGHLHWLQQTVRHDLEKAKPPAAE